MPPKKNSGKFKKGARKATFECEETKISKDSADKNGGAGTPPSKTRGLNKNTNEVNKEDGEEASTDTFATPTKPPNNVDGGVPGTPVTPGDHAFSESFAKVMCEVFD